MRDGQDGRARRPGMDVRDRRAFPGLSDISLTFGLHCTSTNRVPKADRSEGFTSMSNYSAHCLPMFIIEDIGKTGHNI